MQVSDSTGIEVCDPVLSHDRNTTVQPLHTEVRARLPQDMQQRSLGSRPAGGGGGGGGASPVDGSSQVNVIFSSLSSGSLNAFLIDSVKCRYPSGPGLTSKLRHHMSTVNGIHIMPDGNQSSSTQPPHLSIYQVGTYKHTNQDKEE